MRVEPSETSLASETGHPTASDPAELSRVLGRSARQACQSITVCTDLTQFQTRMPRTKRPLWTIACADATVEIVR